MSSSKRGGAAGPAKSAKKAKKAKAIKPEVDEALLKKVIAVRDEMRAQPVPPTIEELGIKGVRQVVEMEDEEVSDEIELMFLQIAGSILAGKGYQFDVPVRSDNNQQYIKQLDRIVLKTLTKSREFGNTATVRKTAIMTRVLQFVHQAVNKGIHITKRDLFYSDVKLFKDQKDSDAVLDDVACMVGCTRTSLNIVASDKGVVVGRVQFKEDGDDIDCTKMGTGGKAIPSLIDKITDIKSDAKFIILVEKDAAFMRLAEDRFYQQYPCIIVTGKGQPDLSTRLFLKLITTKLKIPILGLFDSDPYGLKIMSVYMSGSKAMSYDSEALATSDIKWLGVRPSDLDRYKIPEQCRLDMTQADIDMGEKLLKEEFIQKNPEWMKELQLMLKMKKKAEIQALSSFGFQYLTETYLPQKIKRGDWI